METRNPWLPVLLALVGCVPAVSAGAATPPHDPAATRLQIDARAFRRPDGSRFAWRGLTSFRLVEMVAHGRAQEAAATLDWAARHGVTVVRVLAMARGLFELTPDDGRAALPALLSLARARGLYVEVVALADTAGRQVDLERQVRVVGEICARHENTLLEIANEPWHPTQDRRLSSVAALIALGKLVPPGVPFSLGSPQDQEDPYLGGDYVTLHLSRDPGAGGWRHVLAMSAASRASARTGRPVVDDEPAGAAERDEPGRRDAEPARWYARGVLSRVLGVGATFHFEGGLQGRTPKGVELACFDAWSRGLDALPSDLEERTGSSPPWADEAAVDPSRPGTAPGLFVAQGAREVWVAIVGSGGQSAVHWRAPWRQAEAITRYPGVTLVRGYRPRSNRSARTFGRPAARIFPLAASTG